MAHIHEKIDFVCNVFVVNGDAVLLRKHDKYKIWLPPGGHIELHEDPMEAAVREIKEEVGLDVTLVGSTGVKAGTTSPYIESGGRDLLVPHFLNRHRINSEHEHISFEYFGLSNTRDISQSETEVSDEIHWFTKEDLDDPKYGLKERIAFYAKAALAELGTKK
jgi:8-oxo-dGTP pyrophosphatase MutT (NUDIX family)